MNKLKKIQEELEKILPSDEIDKLNSELLKEIRGKERRELAKEIAKNLKPLFEKQASTATTTIVSGINKSIEIVGSNPTRKGLYFYNDSGYTAFIKLGREASNTSFTIIIEHKGYYELTRPVYTGVIEGMWEGGSILITEIT